MKKPVSTLPFPKVAPGGFEEVLVKSSKEFLTKAAGVIVSRPFYVILVRQIASLAENGQIDTRIIEPFIVSPKIQEITGGVVIRFK